MSDRNRHKNTKDTSSTGKNLPFRPGVGMMIINASNQVFVGRRVDSKANGWQMPQGGIDLGETPSCAALREMTEEMGSNKGIIIAETKRWYSYRVPEFMIPRLWDGKYCGQRQKWFLIDYHGDGSDINIHTENPEFEEWRWAEFDELLKIIIPFKKRLYREVVGEFSDIIKNRK